MVSNDGLYHLRPSDTFIDWNSKKKPNRLTFDEEFIPDGEFDLMDVCKNRLDLFYSKLEGSDIILFSGTSKVDVELSNSWDWRLVSPPSSDTTTLSADSFLIEKTSSLTTFATLAPATPNIQNK